MFPIRAKAILPIEQIIIQSVAVRGQLGDISIWISNDTTHHNGLHLDGDINHQRIGVQVSTFKLSKKHWTKIYEKKHRASQRSYQTMDLTHSYDKPVTLRPGQVRMMYIHSTLESDTGTFGYLRYPFLCVCSRRDSLIFYDFYFSLLNAHYVAIVYDNTPTNMYGGPMDASSIRYEDDKIAIHTGKAHLSFVPFGQEPIWGWGRSWRDRREFVGQIQYGTVYKLWHPERHSFFGKKYHAGTKALLMLQRRNSLFARLPDECIYYILNMCRWDWFEDNSRDMKALYRRRKVIVREHQRQQMEHDQMMLTAQQMSTSSGIATADAKGSCEECCDKNIQAKNGSIAMDIDDDLNEGTMDEEEGDENSDDDFVDDDDDDDDDDDEEEEDDENNDEDSNASSAWERANGYRADTSRFVFQNVSSDEEEDDDDDTRGGADDAATDHHHPWFGRRAVRQVVARALGGARAGYH